MPDDARLDAEVLARHALGWDRARLIADGQEAIAKDRRTQVGTGDRSEKIRTYNFRENRITDHRFGYSMYQLTNALDGDINELIDQAVNHYQSEISH